MHLLSEGPWLVGFSERSDGDLGFIKQTEAEFHNAWKVFTRAIAPPPPLPGFAHQVHGTELIEVAAVTPMGRQGQADALYTTRPDQTVGVFTADCLPILVATPTVTAAVHAGWRSTRGNIIGRTLSYFLANFPLSPSDFHLFMGPCLGPCCLEMGDEVPPTFLSENPAYAAAFTRGKRWHLDLRAINVGQCLELGIPWKNISHVNDCTKCLSGAYYSYRGDHGRSGSLFSFILRRNGSVL
jgi:YfiH family protein